MKYVTIFQHISKADYRCYMTYSLTTTLFTIQLHNVRYIGSITKVSLNALGRNNKIAIDNEASEY